MSSVSHRAEIPRVLAVSVLLLALAACGESSGDPAGSPVVDTLANGTVRVTNPSSDRLPTLQLVEELRIGRSAGEGPELFGQISSLAVDDEGRMLVLDNQARELRVFGPDGEHLRTIGREGGGPGEFGNPVGTTIDPRSGGILVADPGSGRYSIFDRNGEFLATHPRPIGYFAWPWPTGFTESGELWDVVSEGLARIGPEWTPVDTVHLPSDDIPRIRVINSGGIMQMTVVPPFTPRLHWRFDSSGHVWTAASDAMEFTRTPLGEGPSRIARIKVDPIPVQRAEVDSAMDAIRDMIAQRVAGGGRIEGDVPAPDVKPVFEGFLIDDRGGVWVEPTRAAGDAQREFLVLDRTGVLEARVEVDSGLQMASVLPVFRSDRMYAVVEDEMGVPHVVRYRIERP